MFFFHFTKNILAFTATRNQNEINIIIMIIIIRDAKKKPILKKCYEIIDWTLIEVK